MIMIYTLSLLLIILIWLMIAPITLNLDTIKHLYWIRWQGIGSVQLFAENQPVYFRFKLFFWKREIPISKLWKKNKPTNKEEGNKPRKKSGYSQKKHQKILPLLRSFQVKILRLNLDTDDFVLNSYLFPLFFFLNRGSHEFSINYKGQASLQLRVENRLYRMAAAFLF